MNIQSLNVQLENTNRVAKQTKKVMQVAINLDLDCDVVNTLNKAYYLLEREAVLLQEDIDFFDGADVIDTPTLEDVLMSID